MGIADAGCGEIPPNPNDDETNICHCCGYAAPLDDYQAPFPSRKTLRFCEICASTMLSHCISYPVLYGEHRHLWGSIGWIANLLRDEIRASRIAGGTE